MQREVKSIWLAAAMAVGTLVGCSSEAPEASTSALEERDLRATVTVLEVVPQSFVHRFSVQGNVETDRNAVIAAEFAGVVEEVFAREGETVREGQPLMRLNTDMLDRSEAELRTQLDLATEVYNRQSRLWDQGIGSELELLQSKAQKEGLEKGLATLAEQRDMAFVRAPFGGVLDRIFTKVGELAAPGVPAARVVDLSGMYVRAMVSDHYAGRVEAGLPAEVVVAGVDTVRTAISRVGSFINPANRTIEITLGLPNGTRFLPNMFANVWLQDLALDSAVVLPTSLVQQDVAGQNYVYVLDGDLARKQVIELGMGSGDEVLIEQGLAWGNRVVEKGASRIVDGEPVRILQP